MKSTLSSSTGFPKFSHGQLPNQNLGAKEEEPKVEDEEEEEEDFMSDKFLKPIKETSANQTYSEKRKRKLLEESIKNQKKSRTQRELEAREEGLNRDLIQSHLAQPTDAQPESHSKAVQMMLKMGFKPGTSLGLTASNSAKDPIKIVPKSDRSGIGIPSKSVSATKLPRLLFGPQGKVQLTDDELAQRDSFLALSRSRFDGRKIDKVLARACRTCEELDRRRGLESNIFWLSFPPDERESRLSTLDQLIQADNENDPERILEKEDEEDEEKRNWFALDPSTRLFCTLEYLRQEYFYCIWCGCQYDSAEDLNEGCPGEEEDDH